MVNLVINLHGKMGLDCPAWQIYCRHTRFSVDPEVLFSSFKFMYFLKLLQRLSKKRTEGGDNLELDKFKNNFYN